MYVFEKFLSLRYLVAYYVKNVDESEHNVHTHIAEAPCMNFPLKCCFELSNISHTFVYSFCPGSKTESKIVFGLSLKAVVKMGHNLAWYNAEIGFIGECVDLMSGIINLVQRRIWN